MNLIDELIEYLHEDGMVAINNKYEFIRIEDLFLDCDEIRNNEPYGCYFDQEDDLTSFLDTLEDNEIIIIEASFDERDTVICYFLYAFIIIFGVERVRIRCIPDDGIDFSSYFQPISPGLDLGGR